MLQDTLTLYRRTFTRGASLALTNWPVGLMLLVYLALLNVATMIAIPFGIVGGFIMQIAMAACASSWLALVEQVIRSGRIRLSDVPASFNAYLGDLITVFFILWILRLVVAPILVTSGALAAILQLGILIFFNAVPELIYFGHHSGVALFTESYHFISENWIEWFPANFILGGCLVMATLVPSGPAGIVGIFVSGVVLYFAMIVRGFLFQELSTSSRRGRAFRRMAGG